MKEFDLDDIWKKGGEEASQHYDSVRDGIISMAKKKSYGIIEKIKKIFWWEILIGLVLVGWLGVRLFIDVVLNNPTTIGFCVITLFGLMFAVTYFFTFRYYIDFLNRIKRIKSESIKENVKNYLEILRLYKKNLINLSIFLMPIALFSGVILGALRRGDFSPEIFSNPKYWLIVGSVVVVFGVIMILFVKWYYNYLLGTQEKKFIEILEGLEEADI